MCASLSREFIALALTLPRRTTQTGAKIVSTCNDDRLRIWAGGAAAKDPPLRSIPHNNHTGRWLSNFRTIVRLKTHGARKRIDAPVTTRAHAVFVHSVCAPLRSPQWDPRGDDVVLVGAMGTRQIEFFSATSGKRLHAFGSELLTAVPTINAIHPTLPLVASGTASGRLHLWS